MSEEEVVWTATAAFAKGLSREELRYSDYLYGHEKYLDSVWEYVEELQEHGRKAFYEKYTQYTLYGQSHE